MAERDRGQGFGFMYVDIAKLIGQREEIEKHQNKPIVTNNVRTANFNKDTQNKAHTALNSDREKAIVQIRENLDRLQSLHHKLHAMLEDLNKINDSTKKRTEEE